MKKLIALASASLLALAFAAPVAAAPNAENADCHAVWIGYAHDWADGGTKAAADLYFGGSVKDLQLAAKACRV